MKAEQSTDVCYNLPHIILTVNPDFVGNKVFGAVGQSITLSEQGDLAVHCDAG